jgi:hypothetical protein
MRCGNCGHKLTAAALAMGYCPQCGAELRSEGVDGAPPAGAAVFENMLPEKAAPGQGAIVPPPPAAALPPPARASSPFTEAPRISPSAPLPPPPAMMGPPAGRASVPQPPRPAAPHPSVMNFPPTPPPSGNGPMPQGGNRPLAGHELGNPVPSPQVTPPTNRTPSGGMQTPPIKPPQAPLIATATPPQPAPQSTGEPPHARTPKPAHVVDANPTPKVVDAAAPLTMLPTAPRRSAWPAILGTLFILIAVALGGLYIAGNRGIGPLAGGTHPGNTSGSTASLSATPTVQPTNTAAPAPTDTPVPPTATPQPTVPPAPSGYSTYTSGDGVFGLNYPTNWNAPEANPPTQGAYTSYSFTSQTSSGEAVTIDRSNATITPADISTYLGNYAVSSGAGNTFVVTQNPTTQTQGSITWTVAAGTYTVNAEEHKVIGLATNDNSNGFLFFYDAPIGSFNAAPGSTYDTMVTSFTFLR